MMLPTPPCSSAAAMSRLAAESFERRARDPGSAGASARRLVSPAALPAPGCGTGPKRVNPVSGSGSAAKAAPSSPMPPTRIGPATKVSSGRTWPPRSAAVRLGPERVAMEERRPVAEPEREGAGADAAQARRPQRGAVESRVLRRLRERRHHIGERAEGAALEPQDSAAHPCAAKIRRTASRSGSPASRSPATGVPRASTH